MYHLQTDIDLYRNITSIHQRFLAFVTCLKDTMQLLGITFTLYLLKLSAGNGFWRKQNYFENKMCH